MCKSVQRLIHFNFVPTIKFKRLVRWPLAKIQLRTANNWLATRQVFFFLGRKIERSVERLPKLGSLSSEVTCFSSFQTAKTKPDLKASRNLRRFTKKIWGKRGKHWERVCVCALQLDLTEAVSPISTNYLIRINVNPQIEGWNCCLAHLVHNHTYASTKRVHWAANWF